MMYIAYSLKCIRFYHNAYRQFCFLQGTRLYDLLNTYSLYFISYIFILFSCSLPRLLLFIHFHLCYTYHYYIREKSITFRREFDDAYFKIQLEMTNLTREYAKEFQNQAIYPYLSCKLFWQRVFVAESLLYDSKAKIKDKNSLLSSFLRSDISLKEVCGFRSNKMVNYLMIVLSEMPCWVKKSFLWIHKNMMKN